MVVPTTKRNAIYSGGVHFKMFLIVGVICWVNFPKLNPHSQLELHCTKRRRRRPLRRQRRWRQRRRRRRQRSCLKNVERWVCLLCWKAVLSSNGKTEKWVSSIKNQVLPSFRPSHYGQTWICSLSRLHFSSERDFVEEKGKKFYDILRLFSRGWREGPSEPLSFMIALSDRAQTRLSVCETSSSFSLVVAHVKINTILG